jgi:hypothetical protein
LHGVTLSNASSIALRLRCRQDGVDGVCDAQENRKEFVFVSRRGVLADAFYSSPVSSAPVKVHL